MPPPLDLKGHRFGRLCVLELAEDDTRAGRWWRCLCDCGTRLNVLTTYLRTGDTKSCGCLKVDRSRERATKHGMKYTPEYWCWQRILLRCYVPTTSNYHHYGGRGIKMCDRWRYGENGKHGAECFLEDMGPKPSRKHSIDREDVNGDYEPDNCRWATQIQQCNNKRDNVLVTYGGETLTLSQWSRKVGIGVSTLSYRMRHGWTPEAALLTKPSKQE